MSSSTPGPADPSALQYKESYQLHLARLRERFGNDELAVAEAVGGEFKAFGQIERALLVALGLRPENSVIDVGCGCGRLAFALRSYTTGHYTGMDVVPEFVDLARKVAAREDWDFLANDGVAIPKSVPPADFVCFFSVFTHLTAEDSYRYLMNAVQFLKPGGHLVFSFLDFKMKEHWPCFAENVANASSSTPKNHFLSRDAVLAWASGSGLESCAVIDSDRLAIPLSEPLKWNSGAATVGTISLGQSLAVLSARRTPEMDEALRTLGGTGGSWDPGRKVEAVSILDSALQLSVVERNRLNERLRDALTRQHELNLKCLADTAYVQGLKSDLEAIHKRLQASEDERRRLGSADVPSPGDGGQDIPGPKIEYYLYSSPYRLMDAGRNSLSGWCSAGPGPKVEGVRARVGAREFIGEYGVDTASMAARFPDAWTDARTDGFVVTFEVPPGRSQLRIEANVAGSGWCTFLSTPVWTKS